MDEPKRLLDGSGTDLERGLLEELRSYRSSDEMRKRTLAAMTATGSAGLTMAGVVAWTKTTGGKLVLGVSVVSALLVPIGYFWSHQRTAPPLSTVTNKPALPPARTPEPPIESATAATHSLPPAVPSVLAPSPGSVGRSSKRGTSSGTASSPLLREEIAALDTVRATLARRDFLGALSLLDNYFKTFGRRRLQLEAQVLRIEALARGGQSAAARNEAKDFLRRNPKSVHAARLQSLLKD